ncbi:Aste57867_2049 [Aphanomyces stellatus]|uniref:Aste57867_2049 protein n=1 Tax=Aphanomyces stellatus TaxID=120398 RepID=A0A485K6K3_9STRA|nr:hypothetical protein As57867_002045 [Aphanomyces stellatus]VFT79253.1 Aste57867_2049 [Aphanomyces stellatus]
MNNGTPAPLKPESSDGDTASQNGRGKKRGPYRTKDVIAEERAKLEAARNMKRMKRMMEAKAKDEKRRLRELRRQAKSSFDPTAKRTKTLWYVHECVHVMPSGPSQSHPISRSPEATQACVQVSLTIRRQYDHIRDERPKWHVYFSEHLHQVDEPALALWKPDEIRRHLDELLFQYQHEREQLRLGLEARVFEDIAELSELGLTPARSSGFLDDVGLDPAFMVDDPKKFDLKDMSLVESNQAIMSFLAEQSRVAQQNQMLFMQQMQQMQQHQTQQSALLLSALESFSGRKDATSSAASPSSKVAESLV